MISLAFRRNNDTLYEQFVKVCTGPHVHVDLVVNNIAYSAFSGEPFSENVFCADDTQYDVLHFNFSDEEVDAIAKWAQRHVELKTPYNEHDIYYCVLPSRIFVRDIDTEPKSLFCSQACILALRACLGENSAIKQRLLQLNSRTCSPASLYAALQPLATKEPVAPPSPPTQSSEQWLE